MSSSLSQVSPTAFPPGYRASGVLLHVTSLPSPYGIGDLGPTAVAWLDRLHDASQSWWQALPLGPTGYGNSPYQLLSSFAGNWLLLSPEGLLDDGLLKAGEIVSRAFPENAVDYDSVSSFKLELLEKVAANFSDRAGQELKLAYEQFRSEQAHWLDDYALFRAIKARHHGACYLEWPAELVERNPNALAQAKRELSSEIDKVHLAHFLLLRQAEKLKKHARARGVRLIGDLPFYVSPDSSDVWAHPELFQLDEHRRPRFVGGVPPDYFSADGQLWGNPVYDWDALRQTGYRWCIDRIRALLAHVDLIRLDHFRGFAAAWHVPSGSATARSGQWVPAPGAELFDAVQRELGSLPFIAEDLGVITPDVRALLDQFQLPGTRVLQFGFDGNPSNPHLPSNYVPNCVAYTGTHDNNTTRGWLDELPPEQRERVWNYLQQPAASGEEAVKSLFRLVWSSKAAVVLAPLQDILGLGTEARMNVPGQADGNWRWRATDTMLWPANFDWLTDLTNRFNRRAAPRLYESVI